MPDMKFGREEDAHPSLPFPVKIEATLAFVDTPIQAFDVIRHNIMAGTPLRVPTRYSFEYGGVHYAIEVTSTQEN